MTETATGQQGSCWIPGAAQQNVIPRPFPRAVDRKSRPHRRFVARIRLDGNLPDRTLGQLRIIDLPTGVSLRICRHIALNPHGAYRKTVRYQTSMFSRIVDIGSLRMTPSLIGAIHYTRALISPPGKDWPFTHVLRADRVSSITLEACFIVGEE